MTSDQNRENNLESGADIEAVLQDAVRHHSTGELESAERLYRQILDKESEHPDALHLLGVIALQRGDTENAHWLISRALSQSPQNAVLHNNLGSVLREQGRVDEAAESFRRALRLNPDDPQAHHNLGRIWHEQGRPEEAIRCYEEALKAAPDYAEAHNALGIAYQALDRLDEAIEHFRDALAHDPKSVEAHNNLGAALQQQGRTEEAIAALQDALQLDPDRIGSWMNLVEVYLSRGDLDSAVEAGRRMVELAKGDDGPVAHNKLGLVMQARGDLETALSCFRKAVELGPDFAEAHNNVGGLLLVYGQAEEALSCFRRAVELQPDLAVAYQNLARSKKFDVGDKEEIARIKRHIQSSGLPDASLVFLHFALGKMLDDCGAYDEAFDHFAHANRMKGKTVQFDSERHGKWIETIITVFDEGLAEEKASIGYASDLPIFVLGMPRSGTTLVEQILSSHPSVHGAGELTYFHKLPDLLSERFGTSLPFPDYMSTLDSATGRWLAEDYLAKLRAGASDALRVTDKMPVNFLYLGLLALLFPESRIIHCRREALDVCLSIYFQHFAVATENTYAYDLADIAEYHRQYERLMAHWQQLFPDRIYEVKYEDLVRDQEGTSKRLVEHCGLGWDERCLAYHENKRPVRSASHWQVRQPIFTESVGRWKHYERYLNELKEGLSAPSPA